MTGVLSLVPTGQSLMRLKDGYFRWIDVKRFSVHGQAPPEEVLRALLSVHGARDVYSGALETAGVPPDFDDSYPGAPHRLPPVTPVDYESLSNLTALGLLVSWLNTNGEVPQKQVDGDLQRVLVDVIAADRCWHLPQVGEQPRHTWDFSTGPWVELVCFKGGDTRSVSLIVASDD